jgi:hypothetical protein
VKLLKDTKDNEFAKAVSKQLRDFCDDKNFNYCFDSYLHEVLAILFEEYFSEAWLIISEDLNENYLTIMHLRSLARAKNGNNPVEGVLFSFPDHYEKCMNGCV